MICCNALSVVETLTMTAALRKSKPVRYLLISDVAWFKSRSCSVDNANFAPQCEMLRKDMEQAQACCYTVPCPQCTVHSLKAVRTQLTKYQARRLGCEVHHASGTDSSRMLQP